MARSVANLHANLTLNDRASPGLVRSSKNTQKLQADLASAGASMATFASSMASLLITTGALESKTGQYATATLALVGAFLSMVPALQTINNLLRANATIQAFLTTLTRGPVGLGLLATAGIAAAGTAAFLATRSSDERNRDRSSLRAGITVNADLRGAVVRSENDLNEISRRIVRQIPTRIGV